MGYLTGQIAERDPSISRSLSRHPQKKYIFDPTDFRRLRLYEAIFKGFEGEGVIGPVRVYFKPYWKARRALSRVWSVTETLPGSRSLSRAEQLEAVLLAIAVFESRFSSSSVQSQIQ
jgi:hypothetical protein